jgi:hypothetical protein
MCIILHCIFPCDLSLICDNSVTTQHCHNSTLSQLQHCHNLKFVIFQEKRLKVLKCYNFLWVQRRHSCCPAARFANCVMTLYMLKVHLQTFLSIPITQKCQILSCDTLVANERYRIKYTLNNRKYLFEKYCPTLSLRCPYFYHIFTKWISNVTYVFINNQPISFKNCFNFLSRLSQRQD